MKECNLTKEKPRLCSSVFTPARVLGKLSHEGQRSRPLAQKRPRRVRARLTTRRHKRRGKGADENETWRSRTEGESSWAHERRGTEERKSIIEKCEPVGRPSPFFLLLPFFPSLSLLGRRFGPGKVLCFHHVLHSCPPLCFVFHFQTGECIWNLKKEQGKWVSVHTQTCKPKHPKKKFHVQIHRNMQQKQTKWNMI